MLSKVLTGHSFYGSIRYICRDQSRAELLATEGVRTHDYRLMIQDFMLQAELNPAKRQACFHSILSFYPGENPGNDKMVEIAERYLKEIGITNTQYAITKHTDKAHLHLHIIANMVDKNGKSIRDNWVGYKGKKVAQQLTQAYGLIPAMEKKLALTNLQALNPSEATKYKIYAAIQEQLPNVRTIEELEESLKIQGIEVQYKYKSGTNQKQGISFRLGEECFKGSQVDRSSSLGNLEKTLRLQQVQQLKLSPEKVHKSSDYCGKEEEQKKLIPQRTSSIGSEKTEGYLGHEIVEGIGKVVEITLKPERIEETLPYHLLQKTKQLKKKNKSQRIG